MINLIFKSEDFRGLSFAIDKADPTKSLIDQIPDLKQVPEFCVFIENLDKIIKYIILMYDKNSPLVRKFTDLATRKMNAATMAGFDLKVDDDVLQSIYDFIDPRISEMVIGFLRFQNNLLFSMLVSNEQTFFEYQQSLLSAVMMLRNDKDKLTALAVKSKLMDDSDVIAERIEKYYKQIYMDDKAIDFVKKKSSSPESVAAE